jgi:ATP/maltotriose-dependent transcriptional regulator MalT
MRLYDFTHPELEIFRSECNFTTDERQIFEHRASGVSLEQCAELMNVSISTAKRISRRVNAKIIKVIR